MKAITRLSGALISGVMQNEEGRAFLKIARTRVPESIISLVCGAMALLTER